MIVQDVQDVPPIFTLAPPLTRINNSIQPVSNLPVICFFLNFQIYISFLYYYIEHLNIESLFNKLSNRIILRDLRNCRKLSFVAKENKVHLILG